MTNIIKGYYGLAGEYIRLPLEVIDKRLVQFDSR